MTPQKAITLADDVFEQVKQRAEAEGVSLDEAANEALRLGLSESRWQTLVRRGRTSSGAANRSSSSNVPAPVRSNWPSPMTS